MKKNHLIGNNFLYDKAGSRKIAAPYLYRDRCNLKARLMAEEISSKYNLSYKCTTFISGAIAEGVSVERLINLIEFMTQMLSDLEKSQLYTNEVISRMLKYKRCISSKDIEYILGIFISFGYEIEEVLESEILSGHKSPDVLYASIQLLKEENKPFGISEIETTSIVLSKKENIDLMLSKYPLDNKTKFMVYANFRKYLKQRREKVK